MVCGASRILGPQSGSEKETSKKPPGVQSHRNITTPDISTNTIQAHFSREPSHLHCKILGIITATPHITLAQKADFVYHTWGKQVKSLGIPPNDKHISASAVFVARNESEMDEPLPTVALAEARHHAQVLAAFVAERPEIDLSEDLSCSAA